MLATYAKHGQHARLKAPQVAAPAPTHDQIMLAFANEVLSYESAQLNIHFAHIGLTGPCPCDDCRHVEQYPAAFFLFARQVVRKAEWMQEREKLAAEMLASAHAQQDTFRLIDRVDDALKIGALHELTGISGKAEMEAAQ
jgi:hypothetical protein